MPYTTIIYTTLAVVADVLHSNKINSTYKLRKFYFHMPLCLLQN